MSSILWWLVVITTGLEHNFFSVFGTKSIDFWTFYILVNYIDNHIFTLTHCILMWLNIFNLHCEISDQVAQCWYMWHSVCLFSLVVGQKQQRHTHTYTHWFQNISWRSTHTQSVTIFSGSSTSVCVTVSCVTTLAGILCHWHIFFFACLRVFCIFSITLWSREAILGISIVSIFTHQHLNA